MRLWFLKEVQIGITENVFQHYSPHVVPNKFCGLTFPVERCPTKKMLVSMKSEKMKNTLKQGQTFGFGSALSPYGGFCFFFKDLPPKK